MTTAIERAEPNTSPSRELTEAISEALLLMGAVMAKPKPHSDLLVKAWAMALHSVGISATDVPELVSRVMNSQTFFPTPADFIRASKPAEVDSDTLSEVAWLAAIKAVGRVGYVGSLVPADLDGDAAALWVLIRIGWQRLCQELTYETRSFYRAEFVRFYRVAVQGRMALDYLPGAAALQNDAQGVRLTPALVGRPDWDSLPAAALVGQGGPVEEFAPLGRGKFQRLAAAIGGSR